MNLTSKCPPHSLRSLFCCLNSPHKWITAWFSRQRRKKAKKGPAGAATSDAALSPDQIMDFKTEYADPLLETDVTPEQKTESKSKKKKGPGRPRKKVKAETDIVLPRLQPKVTPQEPHAFPLLGANFHPPIPAPQPTPHPTAPSVFMLYYLDGPIPPSSDIGNPCFNQNSPILHYAYNANSVASSPVQSFVPIAQKTVFTPTRRSPRTPFRPAFHANFESQSLQPHIQGPWPDFQTAHSSSLYAHQLATYVPLQEQLSHHQPHIPLGTKENYCPPLYLLPTLLERTAFDDNTNHNQTSLGKYANYTMDSSPWDPTTAPLKHLEVLNPSSGATLEREEVIGRLLDERLAREDPFQASMGLVFLSRLGLGWDCE